MNNENINKLLADHPAPWAFSSFKKKPTRTCHHTTTAWKIQDANGRDVWPTLSTAKALCDLVNVMLAGEVAK